MKRWLLHPRALAALVLFTVLVTLPSIAIGFYTDDYALRAALHHRFAYAPPWFDLYRFTAGPGEDTAAFIAAWRLPWWTSPGLKVHLVRPLTSALFTLDDRLFGDAALGYHLHSIAWYAATVAVVGLLLRRTLPPATAILATLLFAINEGHLFPFGWIACRHMTIAAAPSLAGLAAYARDRRRGRWLGALGLAVGLAGSETALGVFAYFLALAWLGPVARDEDRGARARLASVAPVVGVVAIYAVVYAWAHGGAAHSGGYLDPIASPRAFVIAAATRFPALLANAVLGVPAELVSAFPPAPFVILGIASTVAIALFVRARWRTFDPEERAALRWLIPGAILAIASTLAGFPGARLLFVPNVGIAALFAVLLRSASRPSAAGERRGALHSRRAGAALLALVHLVLAPIVLLGNTRLIASMARTVEQIALTAPIDPPQRVFVLWASDPMVAMYPPMVLVMDRPGALACWSVASAAKSAHRLTRTGPSSLTIEPLDTTLLTGAFETLYRAPDEPLHVGDEVAQCGATYRVVAMREGRPSRIELRLDVPLEDRSVRLLVWRSVWRGAWQENALVPVAIPGLGEGESVDFAWSPGPIGFF